MTDMRCSACFNMFLQATTELVDRRPMIACNNGDTICADCFTKRQKENDAKCPTCDGDLLSAPIVNKTVLEMIEMLDRVREIPAETMNVEERWFAKGACGKVYKAIWGDQNVVIKTVVSGNEKHLNLIKSEFNLAISLYHPNVIRLLGTTIVKNKHFGIVMEKAECGSLDEWLGKIGHEKTAKIALGIIDGLAYLHERKVVHRDIKPQNVLMCGSEDNLIPKIADFGVSKVIQTVKTQTLTGTLLYMAPEVKLYQPYGSSADIYSLAMMLFEMFSGHPQAQDSQPLMKAMTEIMQGKSREIPEDFNVPGCFRRVIERGWSIFPYERPTLSEYRSAMETLVKEPTSQVREIQRNVTKKQQAQEMAKVNIDIPMLSMSWNASCEVLNSKELRLKMVENIKTKSDMASMINDSVLSVMKVVPRHLFIEEKRLERGSSQQKVMLDTAYLYHKPMPATMKSNESSPEIIGTQLSMTEIIQGQSVLLVGIKGGYIQSLVAQLIGINGSLVTVTADAESMNICRHRVDHHCPWKSKIDWIKVSDIMDCDGIVEQLKSQKKLFHTIIYCGAVATFPTEMKELLHDGGNVSIMAPVKVSEYEMRFQLYLRRGKESEMRNITDFGVIFGDVQ